MNEAEQYLQAPLVGENSLATVEKDRAFISLSCIDGKRYPCCSRYVDIYNA
jgi:hypothetical protein